MNFLSTIRDAWITAIIFSLLPQVVHRELDEIGILLAIAFGVGYALGFAVNNYYDAELDAKSKEKSELNWFVNNSFSKLQAITILLSIYVYFFLVFSQFGARGLGTLIVLTTVVWAYSAKPFQFKTRLIFDLLIHGFFVQTAPYMFTLYLRGLKVNKFDIIMLILLFFSSISGQIAGQIRDMDIDRMTHITTSIKLGESGSKYLYIFTYVAMLITLVTGIVINALPTFMYPLLFLGAVFLFARKTEDNDISWQRRYADVVLGIISFAYLFTVIILVKINPQAANFLLKPY